MPTTHDQSQFTSEFGHEVEAERQRLLRRRFLWYTGTVSVFTFIAVLSGLLTGAGDLSTAARFITVGIAASSFILYLSSYCYVLLARNTRWPLIKICLWLIVLSGLLNLGGGQLLVGQIENVMRRNAGRQVEHTDDSSGDSTASKSPETADASNLDGKEKTASISSPEDKPERASTAPAPKSTSRKLAQEFRDSDTFATFAVFGASLGGAFSIFARHFLACLFLPLTPRECIRPLVPLLVFYAMLVVAYVVRAIVLGADSSIIFAGLVAILLSPVVGIPGFLVVSWRHSSFSKEFINRRIGNKYVEMRRELTDARRIHEALFAKPICDGDITLAYAYEPMSQIGGDYLFCKHTLGPAGNQRLNMIMLDVTGHGIPAALTVNRLHGELERIFAEQPNTDPGQVLRLLNRYVNLTLSSHCVYVTGLCVRADAVAQNLEYASGGHPPAFLYSADGSTSELHSTAILLGAVSDAEFDPAMETRRFHRGDRLIAYTDGAFECRNSKDEQLRIAGIRAMIAKGPPAAGDWPTAIIKAVKNFRAGDPQDDTLVVEIQFAANPIPRQAAEPEFFKSRSGIFSEISNAHRN